MMEYRVSLDTVNEVSNALLELVPWRAREGLDILVSDDNERYRSASEAIAQKVEEIGAAIQRSQQVCHTLPSITLECRLYSQMALQINIYAQNTVPSLFSGNKKIFWAGFKYARQTLLDMEAEAELSCSLLKPSV